MSWWTPQLAATLWAMFQALVILLAVVVVGAALTVVERRLLGLWQDRYGPNRVGPFGTLQPRRVPPLLSGGAWPAAVESGRVPGGQQQAGQSLRADGRGARAASLPRPSGRQALRGVAA